MYRLSWYVSIRKSTLTFHSSRRLEVVDPDVSSVVLLRVARAVGVGVVTMRTMSRLLKHATQDVGQEGFLTCVVCSDKGIFVVLD